MEKVLGRKKWQIVEDETHDWLRIATQVPDELILSTRRQRASRKWDLLRNVVLISGLERPRLTFVPGRSMSKWMLLY